MMETIQTQQELHVAILNLEQRQLSEKESLQQHFRETYENLQPVNILRTVITELTDADEVKKEMLQASIALAIGYMTKKIFETYIVRSNNPVTSVIGTTLQLLVTGWITRNYPFIRKIALHFFRLVLNRRTQQQLLMQESTPVNNQ